MVFKSQFRRVIIVRKAATVKRVYLCKSVIVTLDRLCSETKQMLQVVCSGFLNSIGIQLNDIYNIIGNSRKNCDKENNIKAKK